MVDGMGLIERTLTEYECPECGEHTSPRHSCTVHNVSYRPVEYVPASHLRGAVGALQRIADGDVDGVGDYSECVQIYAQQMVDSLRAIGGQYEAAPPNKHAKKEDT